MIQHAIQSTRTLAVFTPLGTDKLLLRQFTGREEISRLFSYDLELLSADDAINPAEILGRNVTFLVQRDQAAPRYFNGFVQRFAQIERSDLAVTYQARVVPWLWFLTQTADCRIFQNKTVPQIDEQIFRDLGFSDFDLTGLKAAYTPREYCVQYRETDFDFVSRLMEEEGIFYFFRHDNGVHRLLLADRPSAYFEIDDRNISTGDPHSTMDYVDQITHWEHGYRYRSGRWAQTDYNFKTPQTDLMGVEPSVVQLPNNQAFEVYDYPGRFEDTALSRERTRVRMEECEAAYDVVTGVATYGSFTPGGRFTVKRHLRPSEVGRSYVLTAVEHAASVDAAYVTGPELDEVDFEVRFTCLPAEVHFRPASTTPKPFVHGPQTATVVGPKGEQIYTDEYGRVKVQFHWDREGNYDEHSSCWLRVSQKHAGKGWGDMDLPRIGEEVIVSFLEGDPDRPIIKGRVYNGANQPPFGLPADKTRSGGKTNTHKGSGYNETTADDTAGAEQLRVNAQYNMDSVIGNSETLQVGVDRSTDIGNNDTLTITVDEAETVGKDKSSTVGVNQDEVVGNNIVIQAGTSITLATGASKIHMNRGGVITITGTFISSLAKANHCIVAPMTEIAGANMLLEAGLFVLNLGGIVNVDAGEKGEASLNGAFINISGGRTFLQGALLNLGEVGAPLATLATVGAGGGGAALTAASVLKGMMGVANTIAREAISLFGQQFIGKLVAKILPPGLMKALGGPLAKYLPQLIGPLLNTLSKDGSLLGKIWNLPNTILGVAYGTLGYIPQQLLNWYDSKAFKDPEINFFPEGSNAIEFTNNPFMPSAMTLGNCVIHGGEPTDLQVVPIYNKFDEKIGEVSGPAYGTIRDHERQHTLQGELLGPLYLPTVLTSYAVAGIQSDAGSWQGIPTIVHNPHSFIETGPQSAHPTDWSSGGMTGTTSPIPKGSNLVLIHPKDDLSNQQWRQPQISHGGPVSLPGDGSIQVEPGVVVTHYRSIA